MERCNASLRTTRYRMQKRVGDHLRPRTARQERNVRSTRQHMRSAEVDALDV